MLTKEVRYTILWTILIFVLAILPKKELDNKQILHIDKYVHVFMYAIQSYLLLLTFLKQKTIIKLHSKGIYVSIILSFMYGLFIEIFQEYILNYRSIEGLDIVANCVGILIGITSFYIIYGRVAR